MIQQHSTRHTHTQTFTSPTTVSFCLQQNVFVQHHPLAKGPFLDSFGVTGKC